VTSSKRRYLEAGCGKRAWRRDGRGARRAGSGHRRRRSALLASRERQASFCVYIGAERTCSATRSLRRHTRRQDQQGRDVVDPASGRVGGSREDVALLAAVARTQVAPAVDETGELNPQGAGADRIGEDGAGHPEFEAKASDGCVHHSCSTESQRVPLRARAKEMWEFRQRLRVRSR